MLNTWLKKQMPWVGRKESTIEAEASSKTSEQMGCSLHTPSLPVQARPNPESPLQPYLQQVSSTHLLFLPHCPPTTATSPQRHYVLLLLLEQPLIYLTKALPSSWAAPNSPQPQADKDMWSSQPNHPIIRACSYDSWRRRQCKDKGVKCFEWLRP